MMLKKKSNPWAKAKMLFAIPVAIAGIALLSTPAASAISSEIAGCNVSEILGGKDNEFLPNGQENASKSNQIRILVNRESKLLFNNEYASLEQLPELLQKNKADGNTDIYIITDPQTPMGTVTEIKNALRNAGVRKINYGTRDDERQRLNKAAQVSPQAESQESEGNQVFMVCEQMPTFPGGEQALMKYLSETLKYPAEAANKGVQGRVIVSFVVEKDGSIGNISVQRSVDPALDAEAMRVVRNMPKWTPGKQRGQAVSVQYMLPINFDMGK